MPGGSCSRRAEGGEVQGTTVLDDRWTDARERERRADTSSLEARGNSSWGEEKQGRKAKQELWLSPLQAYAVEKGEEKVRGWACQEDGDERSVKGWGREKGRDHAVLNSLEGQEDNPPNLSPDHVC